MKRLLLTASITALTAVTLTACGSDTDNDDVTPMPPAASSPAASAPADPSATPTDAMVGTDPATWSPVPITMDMNGAVLQLAPGQAAIFTDLPADNANNNIVVESDAPDVVLPMQPTDDGTMQTNAGLTAIASGTATVTVYNGFPADGPADVVMQLTVTVLAPGELAPMIEESAMPGSDPSTWAPVEISPAITGTTIDMVPGQIALLTDLPVDAMITTDAPSVIDMMMPENTDGPVSFVALTPGTTTLTATDAAGAELLSVTVTVTEQVVESME